jgi:hypothetical protein
MSSKRRSYDTDEITLRKIFAKSATDNRAIGALRVLTADGTGGTYWAVPSTLGVLPSFNQINTPAGNFTADLSYNVFNFLAGTNIGYSAGSGDNELYIYGKSFSQFDISGNNTIYAFQSNALNPVVKFSGTGGVNIRADSVNNVITFDGNGVPISSSLFSFQKAKVLSNTSSVSGGISSLSNYYILNAESPSSILTFVGVDVINLESDENNNAIFLSLNTNSGTISTLTGQISTISTQYTRLVDFSIATTLLSTTSQSNFSTSVSTSYGINSNLSIAVYNLPFANYTTLTQFNFTKGVLEQGISTVSTNYVNLPILFSTSQGLNDRISTFNIISSVSTVDIFGGTVTNFVASNIYYNNGDVSTLSSAIGFSLLDTNGLLSSGLSTLSTTIGTTEFNFFTSTTRGLGSAQYISSSQLISTMDGLGNLAVTKITAGSNVIISPLTGLGNVTINVPFQNDVVSTVVGLGTVGYISSASLYSTSIGLGTYGYLSSATLYSTIDGLATRGYISAPTLYSTIQGLGTLSFISTPSLTSTIAHLGSLGYLSTLSANTLSAGVVFASTIVGLNAFVTRDRTNLQFQTITVNNNNLELNGSPLNNYAALSTSFISSIYYKGENGSQNGYNDFTTNFFISSADIYLDQFSSYIRSTTKILVDFNYSLLLANTGISNVPNLNSNTIIYCSTLLMYNRKPELTRIIPYVTTLSYTSNALGYGGILNSNVINRRDQFQISTAGLFNNYSLPIQVLHCFNDALFSTGFGAFYYGLSNSTVSVKCSSTNSIFVSIFN